MSQYSHQNLSFQCADLGPELFRQIPEARIPVRRLRVRKPGPEHEASCETVRDS